MPWHQKFDPSTVPEYIAGKKYSAKDLELMAEALLREDARQEICRSCGEFGKITENFMLKAQYDKEGTPVADETGTQVQIKFPEYICQNGHNWFKGEGKVKGTKGKHPILYEEHLVQRRKREILNSEGTPDPEIVSGSYYRSHPLGRKINAPEDRARRGLGFYK